MHGGAEHAKHFGEDLNGEGGWGRRRRKEGLDGKYEQK